MVAHSKIEWSPIPQTHRMRINLICHYYPPEIGAPQARLSEMTGEWVRQGHEVTVLTGFPNHPTGVIPPEYQGKIFMREVVIGDVLNFLTFMLLTGLS